MDKVRVGWIGCGGFARYRMGRMLECPEAEIVALADPDANQVAQTKGRYPQLENAAVFDDYKKMLAAGGLDAVSIASPHTLHAEQILGALDAGCHVICEKPLVTSVAQAKEVLAARDRAGKKGMVSYQRHLQPEFRYMKEKIASGEFGAVQFVQALQGQEWKAATAGTWRQVPELSGGGQLNDSGSHLLDILLWVTDLAADTVSAIIDNRGTPVDINSTLSIRFVGGALGSVSIVGDAQHWYEDLTIWCEKGSFFMRNGKLSVSDAKGNRFSVEGLNIGSSHPDRNFLDGILDRDWIHSPFECGLRVIELTEAAWESGRQGGAPVRVVRS